MSVRGLLILVIGLPALLVGVAMAMDVKIPVPEWGREYVQRFPVVGGGLDFELPDVRGPDDADRPLVVIDAGHGGKDPGSVGPDILEKDVVLAIALGLRDELLKDGGIRVAMTREDDRIVTLADRPEIARQLDADLFISIHADSAGEASEVSGASVYTLSNEASSEAAARFASRENNADRLNGVEIDDASNQVSAILVELSQERTQDESTEFARLIQREGEGRIVFHASPRRSAALAVLRAPDVPAVLLELGFLSNPEDEKLLKTEKHRDKIIGAVEIAIDKYMSER